MYIQSTMSRRVKSDCVAHFQALDRARHVADLADKPRADMRKRVNPEKLRSTVAEKGDLDRETFHFGRRALRQSQEIPEGNRARF